MIFIIDEYADVFNHSSNKQTSSSISDKDLENMVGSPYGYTPGQDSVRTDAQLTTGQTQLDIHSTGTLFASYGELGVQQILGNTMNPNASVPASSSSLQTMTEYAASFASSSRGTGGDKDDAGAAVVEEDVFGVSTPTAPVTTDGKSLSEIRLARQARRDGMKSSSRAKRSLNMGATKNYRFDARSNRDFE
jgi:hypothetical protein